MNENEWEFVEGHKCQTCGSAQITTRRSIDGREYSCHCGEEWFEEDDDPTQVSLDMRPNGLGLVPDFQQIE